MFFFRAIDAQSQDSIVRMARLQGLREKYEAIVQHDRNPKRMALVIDFLFARPIFTNRQLANGLNIPFKSAGEYIEKLEEAGILQETTGYARNRIFRAHEIFQALDSSQ